MMENLKITIDKVIDFMGIYQISLCLAFLLNGLIYGINHNLTAFHIYTPTFYCQKNGRIPNSCSNINGTCPSGFEFNDDDYTIVTEWSLVCDNRLMAPMVNTLYYCGVTAGAVINGMLSDKYGRKNILFLCIVVQGILGVSLPATSAIEVFIVIRTLQGFFVQGIHGSSISLLFEYSPPRLRTLNIVLWCVTYSVGAILLASISYEVRNWRMLQYMISIPSVIVVTYMWAVPESIYWLYATNRKLIALKLCFRTAKWNRDYEMTKHIKSVYSNELAAVNCNEKLGERVIIEKATLIDILKTRPLRKHILLLTVVNYSITVAYYGTVFFFNHLSGMRHFNYVIGSSAEIIGMIILYFILKKYGTKLSLLGCLFVLAFFLAAIGFTIEFVPSSYEHKDITVICLAVIGKSIGLSAFAAKILYNSELFPTICRGAALGTCGFFARLGSVSAPFMMILADYYPELLPLGILSILSLISGVMLIFLPDTRNVIFPHSIAESEELWEKKK